jgi:hypothetical protein
MFDPGLMAYDRPGPAPDRLLVARLDGIAKRRARWRKPTEPEIAAAASEFREVAGNRADLLAEVAGVLLGASEGRLDEPRARAAAQLCWPSWRAQAAPRGDHRRCLSQHGRLCVRILSGVGQGDSPERFQDLSQPVVQPARS